ncbi:MAG: DNA translocase FtsK [bacterium]
MKKYLEILPDGNISSEEVHEAAKKILVEKGIQFNEVETGNYDIDSDYLFDEVKKHAISSGKISTAMLQRVFKVGYSRAARLIDMLEDAGIVGEADGARPRKVLIEK